MELRSWATLKPTANAAAATTNPFIFVCSVIRLIEWVEDEVVSWRVRSNGEVENGRVEVLSLRWKVRELK